MTESNLVNVTSDLLQTGTEDQKNTILNQLSVGSGWFILLENSGEKVLAPAVVFNRVTYFTTFSPTPEGAGGDPCYVGEGTARVYIMEYRTGNAVFNLDTYNDIDDGKGGKFIVIGKQTDLMTSEQPCPLVWSSPISVAKPLDILEWEAV